MRNLLIIFYLLISYMLPSAAQPLRLLPQNSHYFEYHGKPIIIVGSGEHYGALMNLDFDYTKYLQSIKQDGLNTTRLFMGAYYEKPGAFGIEKNTLAPKEEKLLLPWQKVNDKYDLTKWNEDYFTRLHDFMKKAAENGVIVEITLFSSYYGGGWVYHPFHGNNNINGTPADLNVSLVNTLENGSIITFQEAYVKKLVKELNMYDHFYFEIQNEPWADSKEAVLTWNDFIDKEDLKQAGNHWKNTLEVPSKKSRDWHQAVSNWIVKEEQSLPKKHLISHNIANFKQPIYATDPNISIYTFHYAHPDVVSLNYKLNKVIGFNETGFAGKEDETYIRQAWRFMMSGGGLFNHLDYSFSVGYEDGTDANYNAPGGGSPAFRAYLKFLKNTIESLDLGTLKPDHSFLGHVEGAFAYAMKDKKNYIVYLEPLTSDVIKLNLELKKGNYIVEWWDIYKQEKIKTENIKIASKDASLLSPAGIKGVFLKIKSL